MRGEKEEEEGRRGEKRGERGAKNEEKGEGEHFKLVNNRGNNKLIFELN